MAYEETVVPISKSQDGIRKMIYAHKGTGVNLISQPPREGFEALITVQDLPYHIRIMATCKKTWNNNQREQEERRVWRVLYWHLKALFEAADSGVIDIRDVILPYVITRDGRTISEHLVPRIQELTTTDPDRLLRA